MPWWYEELDIPDQHVRDYLKTNFRILVVLSQFAPKLFQTVEKFYQTHAWALR